MKYHRKKMSLEPVSPDQLTPLSVQTWLGQELELRGIDAVVYTRYILSLVQQDVSEARVWLNQDESKFFPPGKHNRKSPYRNDSAGSYKAIKTDKRKAGDISVDDLKKSAVVECLLTLSDEESDIKNLVDELYSKLNVEKDDKKAKSDSSLSGANCSCEFSDSSGADSCSEDPAERYYAAFPALSEDSNSKQPVQLLDARREAWSHVAQKSPSSAKDSSSDEEHSSGEPPVNPILLDSGSKLRMDKSSKARNEEQYFPHSADELFCENLLFMLGGGRWNYMAKQGIPRNWSDYNLERPKFVVPKAKEEDFKGSGSSETNDQSLSDNTQWSDGPDDLYRDGNIPGHGSNTFWYSKQHDDNWVQAFPNNNGFAKDGILEEVPATRQLYDGEHGIQIGKEQIMHDENLNFNTSENTPGLLSEQLLPMESNYERKSEESNFSSALSIDVGDQCRCRCEQGGSSLGTHTSDAHESNLSKPSSQNGQEIPHPSSENDVPDDRPQNLSDISADKTLDVERGECTTPLAVLKECQPSLSGLDYCPLSSEDSTFTDGQTSFICDTRQFINNLSLDDHLNNPPTSDVCPNDFNISIWSSDRSMFPSSLGNSWGIKKLLSPKDDESSTSYLWNINSSLSSAMPLGYNPSRTNFITNLNDDDLFKCDRCDTMDKISRVLSDVHFEAPKETCSGNQTPKLEEPPMEAHLVRFYVDDIFADQAEETSVWHNFSERPAMAFRQRSVSADKVHPDDMFSGSKDFSGRSENSAFEDHVPCRGLPQSQSEPSLLWNPQLAVPESSGAVITPRQVNVRYLYKTEPNIMMQLGLATRHTTPPPSVDEPEVSPDTHFIPIESTEHKDMAKKSLKHKDTLPLEAVYQYQNDYVQYTQDIACDESDANYQLFLDSESVLNSDSFIPRFQVKTCCEKSAQTGDTVDGYPCNTIEAKVPSKADPPLEFFFGLDMKEELELGADDEERLARDDEGAGREGAVDEGLGLEDQHVQEYSSDYESMPPDMTLEELQVRHLAELWDMDLDEERKDGTPAAEALASYSPGSSPLINNSFHSIWSCGQDAIPSMPQHALAQSPVFIREQAIEPKDLHKLPNFIATFQVPAQAPVPEPQANGMEAASIVDSYFEQLPNEYLAWSCQDDSALQDFFFYEDSSLPGDHPTSHYNINKRSPDKLPLESMPLPEKLPLESIPFSVELEEEWLGAVSCSEGDQRKQSGNYRKPCTFFMEGSCRRADCRYAHDVSHVTCRFWEQGDCFKGVTCPFLHGYSRSKPPLFKDGDIVNDQKFKLTEQDFPELHPAEEAAVTRKNFPTKKRKDGYDSSVNRGKQNRIKTCDSPHESRSKHSHPANQKARHRYSTVEKIRKSSAHL